VTEVLSEHDCQGWMQGYTLTGRVGLFPSYEAFLGIVTTMAVQYSKFVKMGEETTWRRPHASLNYIETSTLWHQHHNGFSHQNPGFLSSILQLSPQAVRIYLPPDANCALSTIHHCLKSRNYINLIIGSKIKTPVWLGPEEAEAHCRSGASVFAFASTNKGVDPDVVLVGCGVEVTQEVIHAAAILRRDAPFIRVRVVNVTDLMILARTGEHPHALTDDAFDSLFTRDKPIIFNYHGYPNDIRKLLFDRPNVPRRITILGYQEKGTTTTPFRMLTYNEASRFDVCRYALKAMMDPYFSHRRFEELAPVGHVLVSRYQRQVVQHDKYIVETGNEPSWVDEEPKFEPEV
jgi:xylulose-5-phosphate/fructose-6-phosphate phosphoketolase